MTTFIVGSKKPIIPNVMPQSLVTANGGSAKFKKLIKEGISWVPVITPYLLISRSGPYKLEEDFRISTLEQIDFSIAKKLIIRPCLELSENEIIDATKNYELYDTEINCLTYPQVDKMMISVIGLKSTIKSYLNFPIHNKSYYLAFKKKLKDSLAILTSPIFKLPFSLLKMRQFKISTGILALIYSIIDEKIKPPYYVIGIGSGETGHAYGSDFNIDRSPHVLADMNILKGLANSKYSEQIIITDEKLSKIYNSFKI